MYNYIYIYIGREKERAHYKTNGKITMDKSGFRVI